MKPSRRLIKRLVSLPRLIYRKQLQTENIRQEFELTKGSLIFTEATIMATIRKETQYTAEWSPELREKELTRRIRLEPDYLEALNLNVKVEHSYNLAQFKLDLLKNEFIALTSILKGGF